VSNVDVQTEALIAAKLRIIKATIPRVRALKDEDDMKAVLKFTKVNTGDIEGRAKKENTLAVLETLTAKATERNRKRS
jgi:hypothetical protein